MVESSTQTAEEDKLARAGRQVQEIHVVTGLNRDSIKLAIKRATSAIKK